MGSNKIKAGYLLCTYVVNLQLSLWCICEIFLTYKIKFLKTNFYISVYRSRYFNKFKYLYLTLSILHLSVQLIQFKKNHLINY